jgi:hypothetical protein
MPMVVAPVVVMPRAAWDQESSSCVKLPALGNEIPRPRGGLSSAHSFAIARNIKLKMMT